MVLECWVIILILGIMAYMFIRSGRKSWASGVLPLMLVPVIEIIFSPLGRRIALQSFTTAATVRIILYVIFFIFSSVWAFLWAKRLPSGKSRYAYRIMTIGFTLILILIFIRKLVLLA